MKGFLKITTNDKVAFLESNHNSLLKDLQNAVDGRIEVVYPKRLEEGFAMIVNEEGLLFTLPVNTFGSWLYETDKHNQPIVGNICIVKLEETSDGPDIAPMSSGNMKFLLDNYIILRKMAEPKEKAPEEAATSESGTRSNELI